MDVIRNMWLPVVCIIGVQIYASRRRSRFPLPPGPSLLQTLMGIIRMDPTQPWLLFTKWNKQYGHIIYINVGQPLVVIDSMDVARELLDKRSAKYSGRYHLPTISLYGWGFSTPFLPYDDTWRQHRRFFQHGFHPTTLVSQRPYQMQHAHTFLSNLLSSPEQVHDHIATYVCPTIMTVMYGYTARPRNDPLLDVVTRTMAMLLRGSSMFNLIVFNALPFLEYLPMWLPGLGFYRDALVSRQLVREMLDTPFEFVKRSMADGSAQPSLVSEFLVRLGEDGDLGSFDEETIKEAAASGLGASIDTTSSVLQTFFMTMAMHPSAQERAQAEIDAVVGRGRLPNVEDRASLPYVEALLRETLRWFLVIPAGVPHATTEDDEYNGLLIPRGSLVMVNVWGIAHDGSRYQDPHIFNPSRFFTPEGKLNDDDMQYIFGFGRRICPGRYLALQSIWMAIVSILAVFRITKAKNELGEDIEITPQFTIGQVTRPAPFKCGITPRSAESEKLVRTKD